MSSKQANGAPAGGGGAGTMQRPPFRRQGSSIGGGQHPMTVALAPAQRVDYSVTKGGARTWAVLLVFMLLCFSLHTVFSAKELSESAIDIDGDGHIDIDTDMDDDVDEVATQQKHTIKDTTPSKEEHRGQDKKKEKSIPQEELKTADDDDAYVETTLEDKLFAGLRQKMQSLNKLVMRAKTEDDEDEDDEPPQVQPRRERRRQKKRKEEEKIEEEEKEEEKPSKRRRKVQKKQEVEEKEEEEDNDDDDDEKEVEEVLIEKGHKFTKLKMAKHRPEKDEDEQEEDDDEDNDDKDDGKEKEDDKKKEDDEDEDDDEDDNEDEKDDDKDEKEEEEEKEEKEEKKQKKKAKKEEEEDEEDDEEEEVKYRKPRHKTSHITDTPQRQCRRKNCPTDFGIEPRMALLKNNKKLSSSSKRYQVIADDYEDDEDNEDEEENEEEEEEETEEEPPRDEVVAIKKYRSSGRESYKRHAITNRDDHKFRDTLDKGDFLVEKHDYAGAIALFEKVLKANPESPRGHFGKGRAFDIRAEYSSDEHDIDQAIEEYEEVIDNDETPDALFRQAASRLIERARFRGALHKALFAQRTLIDRFPEDFKLQNDFGLTFLMMKRHDDARKVFRNILDSDPNNALALAYYGYILKVADGDVEGGVQYMRKGLLRGDEQITDAKFYYHLGEGLMQLGRPSEAYKVYEQGAELGLFLSAHQRSMYNMDGLTARPWWSLEQTGYAKYLRAVERQWVSIRHEALNVLENHESELEKENEAITIDGEWEALHLLHDEEWDEENCDLMPQTCSILREFAESSNATRSTMKISVLSSGTRVLPHCGPTNTRLQAQLGLVVPSEARIRVGTERKGWRTGRFVVFDDSFEHEFSFDGASSSAFRLVLVIDLWHPEIDSRQRTDAIDD